MTRPRLMLPAIFAASLFVLVTGCFGGQSPTSVPTEAPPVNGKITIVLSQPILNQAGKMFVVVATGIGPRPVKGRLCSRIPSNAFGTSGVAMTQMPADDNPCGLAQNLTEFPAGGYTVTAAVFEPNSTVADKQIVEAVAVDGDVVLQIDGSLLSR